MLWGKKNKQQGSRQEFILFICATIFCTKPFLNKPSPLGPSGADLLNETKVGSLTFSTFSLTFFLSFFLSFFFVLFQPVFLGFSPATLIQSPGTVWNSLPTLRFTGGYLNRRLFKLSTFLWRHSCSETRTAPTAASLSGSAPLQSGNT